MGSEMEERERWRRERRHEEEATQQGWTVVHSLEFIVVIFETIHDPMAPYVPSPWPLGTSLLAFAQVPSPDIQGLLAYEQYVLSPEFERLCPHAPTHPNTPPPPVVPSPCSSALVLGVNAASTANVSHIPASDAAKKSEGSRVGSPRERQDGWRWQLRSMLSAHAWARVASRFRHCHKALLESQKIALPQRGRSLGSLSFSSPAGEQGKASLA